MSTNQERLVRGETRLPNGCTLFWEKNGVGGRRYASDEIGGGVCVWDTSLVDHGTLLMAMTIERELEFIEVRGKALVATLHHDAGAIARCSSCGRYSDDSRSLSGHHPCECGHNGYWSGSFVPPHEAATWSDAGT